MFGIGIHCTKVVRKKFVGQTFSFSPLAPCLSNPGLLSMLNPGLQAHNSSNMDTPKQTSNLCIQIESLANALIHLESDLRMCESSVEFEILMLVLADVRMALQGMI